MSGLLLGGLAGVGVLLAVVPASPRPGPGWLRRRRLRTGELLARAGVGGTTPAQLAWAGVAAAAVVGLAVAALTATPVVAVAFAAFAARVPRAWVLRRARLRAAALSQAWPDVVDNLASGIRAGLSLPEAVAALAESGPVPLRRAFAAFAADHRRSGSFSRSLDALAAELADPTADRVVEALRLAREVGGSDLGVLLRSLSGFLRDEARTRAEVETRQGWTVNAARLALAAPWVVLLLLSSQSTTLRAYDRPAGVVVLAAGGGVSYLAYRWMRHLARLPAAHRASGAA